MSKPYPALCRDCKHSKPEERSEWNLRCTHPTVNAKDHWALAGGAANHGSTCTREREKRVWWAACGMRGRLWEARAPSEQTPRAEAA